jgi:hypothetical protein
MGYYVPPVIQSEKIPVLIEALKLNGLLLKSERILEESEETGSEQFQLYLCSRPNAPREAILCYGEKWKGYFFDIPAGSELPVPIARFIDTLFLLVSGESVFPEDTGLFLFEESDFTSWQKEMPGDSTCRIEWMLPSVSSPETDSVPPVGLCMGTFEWRKLSIPFSSGRYRDEATDPELSFVAFDFGELSREDFKRYEETIKEMERYIEASGGKRVHLKQRS